jgi:hypothetical protein
METECLSIFHLIKLVENNCKSFRDSTSHPSATKRLTVLFNQEVEEAKKQGLTDDQLIELPLLRKMYKHTKIWERMQRYRRKIG